MPAQSTFDAILTASLELFDCHGADAVTMRRVAKMVGVTPMAIYRHFPNRAALLKKVSDDSFNAMAHAWSDRIKGLSVVEQLLALLEPYLDYALAHPHLFDHAFSLHRDDARRYPRDFLAGLSPTFNIGVETISEGMRSGVLKQGDANAVCMTVIAHQHGLITLYRAGRFSFDEVQFRAFYLESLGRLLDGIKT